MRRIALASAKGRFVPALIALACFVAPTVCLLPSTFPPPRRVPMSTQPPISTHHGRSLIHPSRRVRTRRRRFSPFGYSSSTTRSSAPMVSATSTISGLTQRLGAAPTRSMAGSLTATAFDSRAACGLARHRPTVRGSTPPRPPKSTWRSPRMVGFETALTVGANSTALLATPRCGGRLRSRRMDDL